MLQRQQDKLLNLIYTKRKIINVEQKSLKKKKIQKENFYYWKSKQINNIWNRRITSLKRHKRKKFVLAADSTYIRKIKRWTKISEKKAKVFMSYLTKKRRSRRRAVFGTYRAQYHWRGYRIIEKTYKSLKLNKIQQKKYKKLKLLKKALFSKIPKRAFKPANKFRGGYGYLTKKQGWVAKMLSWVKTKRRNKEGFGVDFLKTIIGQQFLNLYKRKKKPWHSAWLVRVRRNSEKGVRRDHYRSKIKSINNWARKVQGQNRRAWFYSNAAIPKSLPYYFQKNTVSAVYPYNKFVDVRFRRRHNPWLSSLISKRVLFNGFLATERNELKWQKKYSWTPFLRNKISVRYKKNKVYFFRQRLLYDRDQRESLKAKKKARIKQILEKTTLPFYGSLRPKQFKQITKKARIKKSTLLSREDIQLSYLELRLDVVVHRLNLAPNILWARRLIQDGSIYVSPANVFGTCTTGNKNAKDFDKMYAHFKQHAYPLKLRDPLNLYKKTLIKRYKFAYIRRSKWKFLLEPLRNINYLTKPGDVILCAPGALINKYKSNPIFWQKPTPSHLLSFSNLNDVKNTFLQRSNAFAPIARKDQPHAEVGVVLFNPRISDLHSTDRIQRSFLRWISL